MKFLDNMTRKDLIAEKLLDKGAGHVISEERAFQTREHQCKDLEVSVHGVFKEHRKGQCRCSSGEKRLMRRKGSILMGFGFHSEGDRKSLEGFEQKI